MARRLAMAEGCAKLGLAFAREFVLTRAGKSGGEVMRILFRVCLFAATSVTAVAAGAQTLEQDAAAFGARQAVDAPDLSLDGSSVLYVTPGPGRKSFSVISNLDSGKSQTVVGTDGDPEKLQWCNFVNAGRVVCRFTGIVQNPGMLLGFARLVALSLDGSDPKLLGQADSQFDAGLRQYDGTIIDWLSGEDNSVLMSRVYVPEEGKIGTNIVRKKRGLGVDRLDTATLRSRPVEAPRDAAGGYMTDGRGNVRLMVVPEARDSGMLTGTVRYSYRTANSRDWRDLFVDRDESFYPLAIDAGINSLYALKKNNGRLALYRIRLDETLSTELVAENPRVDIDDVVRVGDGQKVIGYTYAEEERKTVYFDPEFKSLSSSLSKAISKLPLVRFVDSSADGNKLLIFAESDQDAGRYYLFDRKAKTLNEAMLARPGLEGRALASVKAVTIPGSDGVTIPGYLTLPPGSDGKNLPAVVLPHGGPSARDEWGFDWLAQFLAARGYAVLQPNYRGSAGFGDAWLNENGFKSWRTSIGDVSASARWLASQGIADPQKLAIVGWSYGGYAALQSAATEPGLYKAVVAIAPVTDLGLLKQDFADFTNARIVSKFVGSGPHVSEGSPLRRASAITAPVLLVHGSLDQNVRVSHSEKMNDALRDAGRSSELLTFKGLDHYLDDSDARVEMLKKIGALLDRTIGK